MPGEDRSTEAAVHFELYRLLKNNINESYSTSMRYVSIEPEFISKNKSVDLVIDAEIDHSILHFLAIEVKKPTMRSYLLFEQESYQQVEGYAANLDSIYSVLTDGNILRLFSRDRNLGDYRFELNDDSTKRLLRELPELYEGKRQILSFPRARSLDKEEIAKERDGLVKALIEILKHLEKEKEFKLQHRETEINRLRYLHVGSFKVFSMAIEREKRDISQDQSYILFHLKDLRRKLGMETLSELLGKLSRIPAFTWVDPKVANRDDEFTWKSLKHISFDGEPNFSSMKKQLIEWFFGLSERLRMPT